MPIIIPDALPAAEKLRQENIFVMSDERAIHQDIRPLSILILNLMPEKVMAETQLIRLLSNTPLQIHVTFLKTASYQSKNTDPIHLETFYKSFDEIKDQDFDGMIMTGAPVEHLPFEAVDYWEELKSIMAYSKEHVTSTLHLCWGAQAGLYYHYNIEKHVLNKKIFGIFDEQVKMPHHVLMRGFDAKFKMPHSRYATTFKKDVEKVFELDVLADSLETGASIIASRDLKQIFMTGHPEYSQETLAGEYIRDFEKGIDQALPKNYFKDDDIRNSVEMNWRGHSHLLFANWINYCVYQITPYSWIL